MTTTDLIAILPIIVLAATVIVIMLALAIRRSYIVTAALSLIGLALAFLALPIAATQGTVQVTTLLIMDGYARFFIGLAIAASFATVILAYSYLADRRLEREEFYLLLVLATLGAAVLAASSHFTSFFLGLEILSISLYTMIAYPRAEAISIEAGVKYLILAAASAAFLLFGMALVYAETGTMAFSAMATLSTQAGALTDIILLSGFAMIVVGVGFKLALVPFHMWTPDVHQGAPAPVAGYIATVSKVSVFAVMMRYFLQINVTAFSQVYWLFAAMAILSMLVGSLLALRQNNIKRLLAYSSVANLGYILVAFLANQPMGSQAVAFYFTVYVITTLGTFGVVTVLSGLDRDADSIDDYRGLFWRRPWLAATFAILLFSLAGIPLTAGFIGKFYILNAGVGTALWVLALSMITASAISIYYYLRVIVAMYTQPELGEARPALRVVLAPAALTLIVLAVLIVGLGIYPSPFIQFIQSLVTG